MLKKGWRLKTNEEFQRVFRQGKPLFFGAIACKIIRNDLGHLRLGFSFAKKHLEKAVMRNRARRVISEAFSCSLAEGKQFPPIDIVFFSVKKPLVKEKLPFASIAKSVVEYVNEQ